MNEINMKFIGLILCISKVNVGLYVNMHYYFIGKCNTNNKMPLIQKESSVETVPPSMVKTEIGPKVFLVKQTMNTRNYVRHFEMTLK